MANQPPDPDPDDAIDLDEFETEETDPDQPRPKPEPAPAPAPKPPPLPKQRALPNQPAIKRLSRLPKNARWRSWPTKAEVPGRYNVTPHKLAAAVNRAHVSAYATGDGNVRFNPSELRAVFGPPNSDREDAEETEIDPDDVPGPVRLDPPVNTVHDLMKEVLIMLREVRTEKVDVLKHALTPLQSGIDLLKELLNQSMGRLRDLEAMSIQVAKEREELLSANHVRQLDIKRFEQQSARQEQVMDLAKAYVPELVAAYMKGAQAPVEVVDLLASIDPKMLGALAAELEAPQRLKLEQLIETVGKLRPKAAAPAEPPLKNGVDHGSA